MVFWKIGRTPLLLGTLMILGFGTPVVHAKDPVTGWLQTQTARVKNSVRHRTNSMREKLRTQTQKMDPVRKNRVKQLQRRQQMNLPAQTLWKEAKARKAPPGVLKLIQEDKLFEARHMMEGLEEFHKRRTVRTAHSAGTRTTYRPIHRSSDLKDFPKGIQEMLVNGESLKGVDRMLGVVNRNKFKTYERALDDFHAKSSKSTGVSHFHISSKPKYPTPPPTLEVTEKTLRQAREAQKVLPK